MSAPLILVHGFLAPQRLMWPLKRRLARMGHDVHLVNLSPLCIQDVRRLAGQLDAEVERILEAVGAETCDLVGVSQGGVIGLSYLNQRGGHRRVRRFVCVGAPFRGTWFALVGLGALPLLGLLSRGIWQVMPGSALLAEITASQPPVAVANLALAGDPVSPPSRCDLSWAPVQVIPGGSSPLRHQELVLSPRVAAAIRDALESLARPLSA